MNLLNRFLLFNMLIKLLRARPGDTDTPRHKGRYSLRNANVQRHRGECKTYEVIEAFLVLCFNQHCRGLLNLWDLKKGLSGPNYFGPKKLFHSPTMNQTLK
jgi:hypothetical protein